MRFKTFYEALEDLPAVPPAMDDKAEPSVLGDEQPEDDKPAKKDKSTKDDKPAKDDKKPEKEEPEKEEPKTLKTLFDDNKDKVKTYVTKKMYDAKRVEDGIKGPLFPISSTSPKGVYTTVDDDYLIRDHENIKRQWVIKNADYNKAFEPVNANQKPDAEDFIGVRRAVKLNAFLYADENIKLKDGKTLKSNTYIFKLDGPKMAFATLDKNEFENDYTTD